MKLSTVKWFLFRPQFLPQAFQLLKRRLIGKPERYREEEATLWCSEQSQSLENVFSKLGIADPIFDLKKPFPQYFAYAKKQQDSIPVPMGGPGGLLTLFNIIRSRRSKQIIETGVAYGWSSLAILLAIKEDHEAHLISIDMPYVGLNNEAFVGKVVHPELRKQWTLIRKADRQGIPDALRQYGGNCDLVHYDSDKSYSGRMWAYPLIWRALNPGGVFISDDIQDNAGFKDFCELVKQTPLIHESDGKYVGILIKPS